MFDPLNIIATSSNIKFYLFPNFNVVSLFIPEQALPIELKEKVASIHKIKNKEQSMLGLHTHNDINQKKTLGIDDTIIM